MGKYFHIKFAVILILFAVILILSLGAGAVRLGPSDVVKALASRFGFLNLEADEAAQIIVWEFRLGRTLLAALSGAALAVAGALFQGLFRNPLADPFVIGASSGASLGAAIAISMKITLPFYFVSPVSVAAFIGAAIAVALAYIIAGSGGSLPKSVSLLLTGTALSAFFSAGLSFLLSVRESDLHQIFFWLLGGFGGRGFRELAVILLPCIAGFALSMVVTRPLDVLASGEEAAMSMGLDVKKARLIVVFSASVLTASAVSVSGIIGFVGLVAPHITRLIFGPEHRRLVPVSALIGACLLMAADDVARTIVAPVELPVGVITSLLGAPFFLYLLRSKRKNLGDA